MSSKFLQNAWNVLNLEWRDTNRKWYRNDLVVLTKNYTLLNKVLRWRYHDRIQYNSPSLSIKIQTMTNTLWFLGSRKESVVLFNNSEDILLTGNWPEITEPCPSHPVPTVVLNDSRWSVEDVPLNRPVFSSYLKSKNIHFFCTFWHPDTVKVTLAGHVILFQWKSTSLSLETWIQAEYFGLQVFLSLGAPLIYLLYSQQTHSISYFKGFA